MKKKIIFFLLITTNLCVAQVNLNNGLKAYYPFNDNVPHGKVNDESGNKNHVAFNNALFTYDLKSKNSYYYFNGVDQYMRIPNSPSLNFNNQISISVWV